MLSQYRDKASRILKLNYADGRDKPGHDGASRFISFVAPAHSRRPSMLRDLQIMDRQRPFRVDEPNHLASSRSTLRRFFMNSRASFMSASNSGS